MIDTSRLRPFAAALCAAAIVSGAGALIAQENWRSVNVPQLASRLDDKHTLFLATIDANPPNVTARDLEAGRLVAMGGSKQGGAGMACMSCHGAEGAGDGAAAFARLAGLPAWYMYKQLQEYASGSRPNQVMTDIAKQLTDAEMRSVSSYYAVVEAPYPAMPQHPATQSLQWGGQLAAVGSATKGIPACVNCHGPDGFGLAPSVPYLSGQHADYLALQLSLWKQGVRKNDAMGVMAAIASKMSDDDIKAVSDYYARVRPLEDREAAASAQNPAQAPAVNPARDAGEQRSQADSGAQPAATPDTPGG
jgi:cytochrome c553